MVVEAVVGEDHSVRVSDLPYAPGTAVRLVIDQAETDPEMVEWRAFVLQSFGSVQDPSFEIPESSPSRSIEPIC